MQHNHLALTSLSAFVLRLLDRFFDWILMDSDARR